MNGGVKTQSRQRYALALVVLSACDTSGPKAAGGGSRRPEGKPQEKRRNQDSAKHKEACGQKGRRTKRKQSKSARLKRWLGARVKRCVHLNGASPRPVKLRRHISGSGRRREQKGGGGPERASKQAGA